MWNESMIKSFLVLAGTDSFSEAARQSFFTQQAISKQIARLEKELDTVLFQRMHNGVKLTPAGEIYYAAFQQAIDLVDRAGDEVARLQMGEEEHIRLGYMEMLIVDPTWNAFMLRFRAEHPEIDIRIETYSDGEMLKALNDGDVDAAILFCGDAEARQNNLFYIPLGGDGRIQLCVSRHYPGAAEATSYLELRGIPLFFPDSSVERARERTERIGFPVESIRYRSNISSALVAVNLLEGGMLVGDHCEFRDNPNLLFFDVPDRDASAILAWKRENTKRSLRRMMEQFRIYSVQNPAK